MKETSLFTITKKDDTAFRNFVEVQWKSFYYLYETCYDDLVLLSSFSEWIVMMFMVCCSDHFIFINITIFIGYYLFCYMKPVIFSRPREVINMPWNNKFHLIFQFWLWLSRSFSLIKKIFYLRTFAFGNDKEYYV